MVETGDLMVEVQIMQDQEEQQEEQLQDLIMT